MPCFLTKREAHLALQDNRYKVDHVRWLVIYIFCCSSLQIQANILQLSDQSMVRLAPYVQYMQETNKEFEIEELIKNDGNINWIENKKDDINFGFSNAVYWLKLHINNLNEKTEDWALEIAYPTLDYLEIYFVNSQKEIDTHLLGGDQVKEKIINHPHIVFPALLPKQQQTTLYIRVQTQGAAQVPLVLWQWQDFTYHSLFHFIIQGIFYGIALVMALYSLVMWLFQKQIIYLSYAIYIVSFTAFVVSMNGVGAQFIWPQHTWLSNIILTSSASIMLASLSYFIMDFFTTIKNHPLLYRILKNSFYIYCLMAILFAFIPYSIAVRTLTIVVTSSTIFIILVTIYMLKINHPSARFFALAWLALFAGVILYVGEKFGVIASTNVTKYGFQLGASLEMIFLSFALVDRIINNEKQRILAQEKTLLLANQIQQEQQKTHDAELENLRLEKEHTHQLEIQVNERTLELKQAMDNLSTANDTLQTISITDALTGIYNRYYFDEHWRIEHKRAFRDKSHLAIILLDIDHFKKVNDNYGHPAGDACLKQVATSIRNLAAREPDIVCRYGGEEFVLILPGTDEIGAVKVAQKIRLKIEELKIEWGNLEIKVTASLGISSLIPNNSNESNREYMLNQADQALYQAKHQGRNQAILFIHDIQH